MGTEADTKSPWNEGRIGTGRGYNGVTDSSIDKVSYRDAQCAVNIGSLAYIYAAADWEAENDNHDLMIITLISAYVLLNLSWK